MQPKRNLSHILLSLAGVGIGLISILGGILAFRHGVEPERYLVSAVVMICSGILWLICSVFQKFHLTSKQYILLLSVLLFGLIFGLFSTFTGCGGECGGPGYCTWYLGYPGRWLRIMNCMAGATGPVWLWIMRGNWGIDFASFIADLVFWSGIGLMTSFLAKKIRLRTVLSSS